MEKSGAMVIFEFFEIECGTDRFEGHVPRSLLGSMTTGQHFLAATDALSVIQIMALYA